MKNLILFTLFFFGILTVNAQIVINNIKEKHVVINKKGGLPKTGCASELIISEYIEGSSNNKYLELYNDKTTSVNLDDYDLMLYSNGSSSATYTLNLSGILASGATYVIENSSESLGVTADLSTTSNVLSFNGNDAIELYNTNTSKSVDIIGQIGTDPGSQWGSGVTSTKDNTIVRKSSVIAGDTDGTNAFDPSTEWDGYAIDDVSHLGSHTMTCSSGSNASDIILNATFSEPTNIPYATYQVADITGGASDIEVAKFTIRDGGASADADNLSTILTDISFSLSNSADIRRVAIYDGATEVAEVAGAATVTFTGMTLTAADDGTKDFSIRVSFNASVTDNDQFQFVITSATEDNTKSTFADADAGGASSTVSGDENKIEVTASKLLFVQDATTTTKDGIMTSPSVEAVDALDNRDLDFSNPDAISISSDGTMTGDPISVNATAGLSTFNSIVHTVLGTNFTLTASATGLGTVASSPFDITDACTSELFISEYCEGSSNNKYIEIYNGTGNTIDFGSITYTLNKSPNGGGWSASPYTLTGTLADGATFVLANDGANGTITAAANDTENSITGFNGNDAIGLFNSGTLIDVIGVENESSNWAVAGTANATENHTLIRKSSILSGNTNWATSAGTNTTNSEWVVNAIDNFTDIGAHTILCTCDEPTLSSTNMTFSSITDASMTVSWTNGDGASRIVVAKKGSLVDFEPTDNNSYSANSSFGAGTALGVGADNYVVYNGSGNTFNVTNLEPGYIYYFEVFEYNCSVGSEDYLVSTSLVGNQKTAVQDIANLTVTCLTNTTATIVWDNPQGQFDGVLIAVRQGGVPSDPSCAGSTLTSTNTDFSLATDYCGNSTSSKYVYNSNGTSVTITGLTNATSYNFKAFSYQGVEWASGRQKVETTGVADVTNENTAVGNTTLDISWTNPVTCHDEILVVTHSGGSVSTNPIGDGSAYTANATFGSGTDIGGGDYVTYKGSGIGFTLDGLTNGTNYCSKIFVRKDSEWSLGVEVCETPADITVIEPGDLAIVAVNTNNTNISGDEFTFVCFKDIKVGTPIDFTDNGWERKYSNKWGTTEGTIRLTRTGNGTLVAGTTITIVMNGTNGNNNSDFDIFVGGVDELAAGYWSISKLNSSDGAGFNLNAEDDIWIMQNGAWVENTTGSNPAYHDDDYTGNVLYGWTATGWPGGDLAGSVAFSNLYPYSDCFNTDVSGLTYKDKVKYTGPMTAATQYEWIARINDETKWTGYADDATYDAGTPQYRQSGASMPVNAGGFTKGVWTGTQNQNWFDCGNWQSLTVPDETTDVIVGADATKDCVVDDDALKASDYGGIAKCNDLTISNKSVKLEGDVGDKLEIHGELNINTGGVLDMSDGTTALDGTIDIYGDWRNNDATAAFLEGQSTVEFKGISTQTINSAADETFYNLITSNASSTGVLLANKVITNGKLTLSGILDLNGADLNINGDYERTSRFFVGNQWSNLDITGTGDLSSFYFSNTQQLSRFSINRTGKTATINDDFTTDVMTITNGTIELLSGKEYTITGTLSNSAGATGLILRSDAFGTASLIQAVGDVEATCERYMTIDAWHFYFTPLSNADISIFTDVPGIYDNPNFYFYDEDIADYWKGLSIYTPSGWTAPDNTGKILTDRGYIHQYVDNNTYSVTGGNLFASDKNFTLSYTDSGSGAAHSPEITTDWDNFEGWNLFGNPYTSAIDWNAIPSTNKNDIEGFVYYWDDVTSQYKCFGGSPSWNNDGITVNGGTQYIPANQGFFVKAKSTADGSTFTIPANTRVHNSQTYWKSNSNINDNLVRLNIERNGETDETVIRTLPANSGVTEQHDGAYDAYKMFSWKASSPQIFSRNNENTYFYAVNSLPEFVGHKIVPLGVYTTENDEYKINLLENSFSNTHIWLEDRSLNVNTSLLNTSTYTFNQVAEQNDNRFYLHFDENHTPQVAMEIPNQTIMVNDKYSYAISENIFNDIDIYDQLTLSVTQTNGENIPEWLSFNPETRTFTGIASHEQILKLKVTASDIFNAEISDVFVLNVVRNPDAISEISEKNISIYPNPSKGIFTIEVPASINYNLEITSVTGQLVYRANNLVSSNEINIDNLAKGIYFIDIKTKSKTIRKKIVVQ